MKPDERDLLTNLKKRANLQASIRSYFARRLILQQKITDVSLLMTGFLLAIAIFMDRDLPPRFLHLDADAFMFLAGSLGILNFAAALALLYIRPGPRGDNQRAARRHYTDVLREIHRVLDLAEDIDVHALERRFLADDMFEEVPDRLFLIYKDRHERKVAISKMMSDGLSLKEARRRRKLSEKGNRPPN